MANAPRSREKNVTGAGHGVHKRGSGLGSGPVGGGSHFGGGSGGGPNRSGGGGSRLGTIILIAILLLGGGGGGLSAILGGGSSGGADTGSAASTVANVAAVAGSLIGNGFGGNTYANVSGSSGAWVSDANTGILNREVAAEARPKYTTIKGGGKDTVTIMVYMCGTDLESKYGMASNDLNEMKAATLSDQVRILVYTGGCNQWKNTAGVSISNRTNQIYRIESGKISLLEDDLGDKAMTDPATLSGFIRYCSSNYPADRNMLIFWDHGGGSLSGYGYDEKHSSAGSMSLAGIDRALKDAGIRYDFIGFDACLMATVETDLMCASYADYIIASEETEPGVGWYYTNWLTALSKDTSMPTVEVGKNIIDDFVTVCGSECRGQKTTLSIVDLAELSMTLGDDFRAFSHSTTELITENDYRVVSDARSSSREFAQSSQIDQIDLVNFALNLGTEEGQALAQTLLSAVKYNRTSAGMTNAYGISIYFPYRRTSKVATASRLYDEIGLDEEYSDCIREFAGLQGAGAAAGQASGGGAGSPFGILSGQSGSSSGGAISLDEVLSLVGAFSGGRSMSDQETAEYIAENTLDTSLLHWMLSENGSVYLPLPEEQWALVHSVDLNMFCDDGEGYIDLGLDNIYSIDDNGNLIADTEGTWLSIEDQPVAYYHVNTTDDGEHYTIMGYVPAMLNGERVRLILLFTDEEPKGYIAGADPDYEEEVTETVARGLVELKDGDTIDFLCDYYSYDGEYQDSYYLGDPITVSGELTISDTYVEGDRIAMYKFTDIYNQTYWSDPLPEK